MYGACAGDYFPKEIMVTIICAWTPLYGSGAILTHWSTGMLRDVTGIYNYAFIVYVVMGALSRVVNICNICIYKFIPFLFLFRHEL